MNNKTYNRPSRKFPEAKEGLFCTFCAKEINVKDLWWDFRSRKKKTDKKGNLKYEPFHRSCIERRRALYSKKPVFLRGGTMSPR